jgi:hypothetical protein
MSMKNSNDTIGNRTRELPACSAVPQPTVQTLKHDYNVSYKVNMLLTDDNYVVGSGNP